MQIKNAYSQLMLDAQRQEDAGDFRRAIDDYYEALRCVLYDLMLPVSSDLSRAAQEGRYRCFRAIAASTATGGDE